MTFSSLVVHNSYIFYFIFVVYFDFNDSYFQRICAIIILIHIDNLHHIFVNQRIIYIKYFLMGWFLTILFNSHQHILFLLLSSFYFIPYLLNLNTFGVLRKYILVFTFFDGIYSHSFLLLNSVYLNYFHVSMLSFLASDFQNMHFYHY